MALLLRIEIEKIIIYPLGGISKFHMPFNIKIWKEFLLLIFGPIFQCIAYFLLIRLIPSKIEVIKIYHYSILIFNLLPIYPLDGGKLLSLLLECFIPYKQSLKKMIIISYIITLLLFFYRTKTINNMVMVILLVTLITKENKKIEYVYNKFLLERYLKNPTFKKKKIINNINKMYRERNHILKERDKYYLEKEYLEKIYHQY